MPFLFRDFPKFLLWDQESTSIHHLSNLMSSVRLSFIFYDVLRVSIIRSMTCFEGFVVLQTTSTITLDLTERRIFILTKQQVISFQFPEQALGSWINWGSWLDNPSHLIDVIIVKNDNDREMKEGKWNAKPFLCSLRRNNTPFPHQSVELLSRLDKFANERSCWVCACLLRTKHLEKEHVQAGRDRNDHADTLFICLF